MRHDTRTRIKARRAANEAARNEEIRRLMDSVEQKTAEPANEANQSTVGNVPPATDQDDGKE